MKSIEHRLGAFFTFLIVFIVYYITVAPTVPFWDCGEFIACAVTLGVPHPPGAPLFVLIGKLFSFFPTGANYAFRVNMISVLSSALTVMMLYLIIVRLIKRFIEPVDTLKKKLSLYGGGVIGALTYAFTNSFWFNATEAEVYALSMLFFSFSLWLILRWLDTYKEPASIRYFVLCFYLFGLAVGIHQLCLLVIPTIFVILFFYDRKLFWNLLLLLPALYVFGYFVVPFIGKIIGLHSAFPEKLQWFIALLVIGCLYIINKVFPLRYNLWVVATVLIVVGLSTYIVIYIRANIGPVLNEGDPSNWDRFLSYWNREQYGTKSLILTVFEREAPFWSYQIKKMFLRYFAWNFIGEGTTLGPDRFIVETFSPKGLYYLPFLLGLAGFVHHIKKDWKFASAIFTMFIFTGVALVIYQNQADPQPRERDYFYVGCFFAYSIWVGMGVAAFLEYSDQIIGSGKLKRNFVYAGLVVLAFGMGPLIEFNHNFHTHDRHGDYMAWDYSYNILQSCEQNGIIFTNGDNDTFPLWYLQQAEGIRKDIAIVNLSLLNTNWYIKQLKYSNPPIQIAFSDEEIEIIQPKQWEEKTISIPAPAAVYNDYIKDVHPSFKLTPIVRDTVMTFVVKPTIYDARGTAGLRVQDIMVEHIIRENKWRRPVYYAMTVAPENKIGLDSHLRMDGLALKITPYTVENGNLAIDRIRENLFTKFKYRGLNDPKVYLDTQKKDLIQNIRVLYITLANYYLMENNKDEAIKMLDDLEQRTPLDRIPFPSYQTQLHMGFLYFNAGQVDKLKKIIELTLQRDDIKNNSDAYIQIAQIYAFYLNEIDPAIGLYKTALSYSPNNVDAYSQLISIYQRSKRYPDAIRMLEDWLIKNPNDTSANTMLQQIKQMSISDTTVRK